MAFKINRRELIKVSAAATFTTALLPGITLGADPINVGSLTPNTGGGGPFGPNITAAHKMVADMVNAAGGINSREIALYQENSETNPETAVRAARKLVDVNNVLAVIGTWSSSVTLGIMPLCQESDVIQMCTSSSSSIPVEDKKTLVFNFIVQSPVFGEAMAVLALDRGLKTFRVMGLNNDFTSSMVAKFVERVEAAGGSLTGESFYYNGGQASYRAEVAKAMEGNPDAIFVPSYVTDFTAVYKELFRQGYEGRVVTLSIATGSAFKEVIGEAGNGILHGLPVPALNSDAYRNYLGLVGLEDNGNVQHPFGTSGYDQMSVLLLAAAHANSSEGPVVAKSIEKIANGPGKRVISVAEGLAALAAGEDINYSGASSEVDYEPGTGVMSARDFGLWEIIDGADKLISIKASTG